MPPPCAPHRYLLHHYLVISILRFKQEILFSATFFSFSSFHFIHLLYWRITGMMRKQGAKWSVPGPPIKTAWHPGLHRLITKGWNLFFYIWRKHCLHNTDRFTVPSSNPGLQHTAIRQNMDGQPVPWSLEREMARKGLWRPTVSNKNSTQKIVLRKPVEG